MKEIVFAFSLGFVPQMAFAGPYPDISCETSELTASYATSISPLKIYIKSSGGGFSRLNITEASGGDYLALQFENLYLTTAVGLDGKTIFNIFGREATGVRMSGANITMAFNLGIEAVKGYVSLNHGRATWRGSLLCHPINAF